jgi:hypothetical protein
MRDRPHNRRNVLRIANANTADPTDSGYALIEGGEAAIAAAAAPAAVLGAPRIVLGIGVRARSRDADEKR